MSSTTSPLITDTHIRQFQEEGYFILERALDHDTLEHLRTFASDEIERCHRRMDAEGVDVLGLNRRNSRYFIPHSYKEHPKSYDFIFGALMEGICRATLGENAHFFLDQYVIKAADKVDSHFSWHQDSGYIAFDHEPYVTCWTTLDDVDENNGTVYLLPYSHIGVKTRVRHIKDPERNDMVGYFGKDAGVPVLLPAGSVAVFSSVCFHRSGANQTDSLRRVMLTQYSADAIVNPFTGQQQLNAIAFLKDGERVDPGFDAASKAEAPGFKV